MLRLKDWSAGLCLFFLFVVMQVPAQVQPIIDNCFLSTQAWGGAIHPSGKYMVRADRTTIHAYDRFNKILFQTYQGECIANEIRFSADGNYLIVQTSGEIAEECNKVLVFDFYSGKEILNIKGSHINSLTNGNLVFVIVPLQIKDSGWINPYQISVYNMAELAKTGQSAYVPEVLPKKEMLEQSLYPGDFINPYPQQLLIDSLLFVNTGGAVSVYNIFSCTLSQTLDSVKLFSSHYDAVAKKLFMAPSVRNYSFRSFDVVKKNLKELPIDNRYNDHVLFENDSIAYKVKVYRDVDYSLRPPYNCVVEKINIESGHSMLYKRLLLDTLNYDIFSNDSYYSQVVQAHKLVLHNKTHLIDLNNFSAQAYRTAADTTLLHPAAVSTDPFDPNILYINDQEWNIAGNGQIKTAEALTVNCSDTLYSDYFEPSKQGGKQLMQAILQNHSKINYSLMSYPVVVGNRFFSEGDYKLNITDENYEYFTKPTAKLKLYESPDSYYLWTNALYMMQSKKIHYVKIDKEKNKAAEKQVSDKEFQKRLYELNKNLPTHIIPFNLQEAITSENEKDKTNISLQLRSQEESRSDKNTFLFAPVAPSKKLSFKNIDEAKKAYISSLFKSSVNGNGNVQVNTLNRAEVPDLTYSGIIPENDVFFYDLFVPLPNKRTISLNYAHGDIKLFDANNQLLTKSSFYLNGEFIHITKEGYYFASRTKLKHISIRLNDKVYPLEQFDLKYNRPDLVLKQMGSTDTLLINAYHRAYLKRLKKNGFTEDMLKEDFHLPELHIKNPEALPLLTDSMSFHINLNMYDSKYKLDRLNVYINDVPVYGSAGIDLRTENTASTEKKLTLILSEGLNKITLSVLNQSGAESYKETVTVMYNAYKPHQPDLYLISIGDSKYRDARYNLTYASKDAADITAIFTSQTNAVYDTVYATTLVNEQVTRTNILALKKQLQQAKREDVVIITIAGHGVLDKDLNYYLAAWDMNFENPADKGIPYEELESLVDGIAPLKKVLFIDACHSGEVDKEEVEQLAVNTPATGAVKFRNAGAGIQKKTIGLKTSSELMNELFSDLRKGTGATIIASAGGAEYAMESEEWKNGLFTYCMLHGLKDLTADLNGDGIIMMSELQQYLRKEVSVLSKGAQQPGSRIENNSVDFRIW